MSDREPPIQQGDAAGGAGADPGGGIAGHVLVERSQGDVTWLDPPIPLEEGLPGGVRPEEPAGRAREGACPASG